MNEQHDRPMAATAGCDMRQRSPQEIAEQLERDAVSLTLTGASFDKDKAFYENVAANVREAVAVLQAFGPRQKALLEQHEKAIEATRCGVLDRCIQAVNMIRESVPNRMGHACTWRDACNAVGNAFVATRHSSLPMQGMPTDMGTRT